MEATAPGLVEVHRAFDDEGAGGRVAFVVLLDPEALAAMGFGVDVERLCGAGGWDAAPEEQREYIAETAGEWLKERVELKASRVA